jgi:hypothetical protein
MGFGVWRLSDYRGEARVVVGMEGELGQNCSRDKTQSP